MIKFALRICAPTLALALLSVNPLPIASAHDHDSDAVRHVLMSAFDKPEARLIVEPVVASGDAAIAGWIQGEMGGRALLRRKGAIWVLILCSGDQLKDAATLQQVGLPADQAQALAAALAAAEARMPRERLAAFSRFDGLVMMDAAGQHPPVSGPHGATHGGAKHP